MSFELAFRSRVASIMETLTEKAVQDICQLMGETYAALRVEMLHEQNQRSIKLQAIENNIRKEKPANCMEIIEKPASPTGLRNFPVVEQILNEQEANSLWLEGDPTVEDEGPPSLVPEEEQPSQAFGQMTDMGVETWPAPPVIKQEEMDDDNMESQGYGEWIPETHKANQNIRGESDEDERSPASGGSKELGLDDFKGEQSPLLVSTEDAAAPTKKKYNNIKMYTCEICGKIETKKGTMTSHMIKHTGLPFSCDICGKKFKLRDFLTRHKRSNHYTGIIYSCSVCEKTFRHATSRDTHERGHTGKNYWCSDCGETFKERQERDTHECIVYKGERPFSCSECNKDFERQYHLKQHQLEKHPLMVDQTVHYKSRCSVCGKAFMYNKWLIKHERTHRGKNERRDRGPHESIVEDPINKQLESKDLEGLRNFPVVDQILNEQEANGIWQEREPTLEDTSLPSLVPEGEEQSQALSQTTDMGVETLPVSPVIKQDDDDNMESQGYSVWIPETHKANQNIRGESDENERSPASGGSKELGLDDFKGEQSPLLVSAEDAAAPTK
ncbi:zinc finger and SCAN domain-containing protein 12 isoform X1 [Salmo trutta]|uniref:zinc finger and SCAN domain-containing protein 12 isoform X1 n=1 Tax=Salmo trutta TaxID=8032 RepID=UPI001130E74B|nr:zinc finger and SCAN domain-containing protein 12-like isoform X1 [Salmo trutta]